MQPYLNQHIEQQLEQCHRQHIKVEEEDVKEDVAVKIEVKDIERKVTQHTEPSRWHQVE